MVMARPQHSLRGGKGRGPTLIQQGSGVGSQPHKGMDCCPARPRLATWSLGFGNVTMGRVAILITCVYVEDCGAWV